MLQELNNENKYTLETEVVVTNKTNLRCFWLNFTEKQVNNLVQTLHVRVN